MRRQVRFREGGVQRQPDQGLPRGTAAPQSVRHQRTDLRGRKHPAVERRNGLRQHAAGQFDASTRSRFVGPSAALPERDEAQHQ